MLAPNTVKSYGSTRHSPHPMPEPAPRKHSARPHPLPLIRPICAVDTAYAVDSGNWVTVLEPPARASADHPGRGEAVTGSQGCPSRPNSLSRCTSHRDRLARNRVDVAATRSQPGECDIVPVAGGRRAGPSRDRRGGSDGSDKSDATADASPAPDGRAAASCQVAPVLQGQHGGGASSAAARRSQKPPQARAAPAPEPRPRPSRARARAAARPSRAPEPPRARAQPQPQPTLVPLSRPFGTGWPAFRALNSSRASVLFHSTESPAFV
jgi:hypothetical protein